jgi:hypothetical protein
MTVKYKNNEKLWMIPWIAIQSLIDGQHAIKVDCALQMAKTPKKAKAIATSVIKQLPNLEGFTVEVYDPVLIDISIINKVVEEI